MLPSHMEYAKSLRICSALAVPPPPPPLPPPPPAPFSMIWIAGTWKTMGLTQMGQTRSQMAMKWTWHWLLSSRASRASVLRTWTAC